MSKCRFAVVPSVWSEAGGIVALEAMSQRKAVIATAVGGLKESVADGKTGLLVPPGDVNELCNAMSRLLEDPDTAKSMGENGYDRFIGSYTTDAVIPRIVAAYKQLI
jgi:glycosyltransferase involved in cell wall biosynthesis